MPRRQKLKVAEADKFAEFWNKKRREQSIHCNRRQINKTERRKNEEECSRFCGLHFSVDKLLSFRDNIMLIDIVVSS